MSCFLLSFCHLFAFPVGLLCLFNSFPVKSHSKLKPTDTCLRDEKVEDEVTKLM